MKRNLITCCLFAITTIATPPDFRLLSVQDCEQEALACYKSLRKHAPVNSSCPQLWDTKFLAQADKVREYLIAELGFKEVELQTRDGLRLEGLYRSAPDAPYTAILSSGFFPGKMTGLAPFADMFDSSCNMLFIQARGKGKSEGLLQLCQFWRYGVDDYLDVVAGIEFAAEQDQSAPIFLYGICAGAFHSAHAIARLNMLGLGHLQQRIAGFVFDSGWLSVPEVSVTALPEGIDKELKAPYLLRLCLKILVGMLRVPCMWMHRQLYDQQTNLRNHVHQLNLPMLVIHSYDDTLAPIKPVLELVASCADRQAAVNSWCINNSRHAFHHIKHRDDYRRKLTQFVDDALLHRMLVRPVGKLSFAR